MVGSAPPHQQLYYKAHYRLSLLTHLHQLATHQILNNHSQLQLTVESSALRSTITNIRICSTLFLFSRLITGLGNSEISPPKNSPAGGAGKSSTL